MDLFFVVIIAITSYIFGFCVCMLSDSKKEEYVSLNLLAEEVARKEGKKKATDIAQIKEIMRIIFQEMAKMRSSQLKYILKRYK
jgi:hypothetical protein